MPQIKRYCVYCGRVAHRCNCAAEDSRARQFFTRGQSDFVPQWMTTHYKRGVPPQIKKRERASLRRNYKVWYAHLVEVHGEICANCGTTNDDEIKLVIDHILSIAKGGLSELENLQLLCAECNRIKGKLYIDCRIK